MRNGDDISVTFTKDIQPARVLETNISVTGELNGHDLRHSVGLQLGGQKAATQATLRLGASDFTQTRRTDGYNHYYHYRLAAEEQVGIPRAQLFTRHYR